MFVALCYWGPRVSRYFFERLHFLHTDISRTARAKSERKHVVSGLISYTLREYPLIKYSLNKAEWLGVGGGVEEGEGERRRRRRRRKLRVSVSNDSKTGGTVCLIRVRPHTALTQYYYLIASRIIPYFL